MKIKLLKAISVFGWIAFAVSIALPFIGRLILKYFFDISTDANSSIGIIGGADGPTMIYTAAMDSPSVFSSYYFYLILFFVIAVVPTIIYIYTRHRS